MKKIVDEFISELEHTKLTMYCWREVDGKKEEINPLIQCQVRILPGALLEFVFPKEHQDIVLTALNFHGSVPYNLEKSVLGIKPLNVLKKFLSIEPIPKFKTDKEIPLIKPKWMAIIPLGVRYDGELTEKDGWTHEAI